MPKEKEHKNRKEQSPDAWQHLQALYPSSSTHPSSNPIPSPSTLPSPKQKKRPEKKESQTDTGSNNIQS